MSELSIQSVTISVELADKEYGNGTGRFVSLRGGYNEGGVPLKDISSVIDDSLVMFLASWKTLLSSSYAQGAMKGEDFKTHFDNAIQRTESTRKFLKRKEEQSTETK